MRNSGSADQIGRSLGWTLAASTCVALTVGAGLWAATAGFRALALDEVKAIEFARHPAPLPAARLDTGIGRSIDMREFRGGVLVVEFIYTRCTTLCSALGGIMGGLQRDFYRAIARGDFRLLSVSFDIAHDDAAEVAAYRHRFGTPQGWLAAIPETGGDLRTLQRTFGFLVQDTGDPTLAHSSKLYVVSAGGDIVGAFENGDREPLGRALRRLLETTSPDEISP